ncbi:MAG: hypothetical protein DBX59_09775 [Bacillota bacterium]|nr:MAG: hypothetical protein DBX59_09775 [Bacillota bacterium]
MFGYIRTDLPNLYIKDSVLYKALYCGLCKSIGGKCGQCGRFTLNYDLTFLSALFHNLLDIDVEIKQERCVLHWIIRRPVAKNDALTERIGCLNVIMAHYKLADDIADEHRGRGKSALIKKAYKRAKASEPKLDEIVKRNYAALVEYEKKNGDSIDVAADSFGNMVREISAELLGEKSCVQTENLSYNLGKWIYLIDALDDFDKDKKKKRFNPFVNAYSDAADKKELCAKYEKELEYIFGTLLQSVAEEGRSLRYAFNHDLTDNILFRGLGVKTKQVMQPCTGKKCRDYKL